MCDHHGEDETCDMCEAPPELAVLDGGQLSHGMLPAAPLSAPSISHIAGILSGDYWNSASVSFGFTTSSSQYASSDTPNGERPTFTQLSEGGKAIFRDAISQWDDVSGLTLTEASAPGGANIRVAGSNAPSTAWAYYPNEGWGGGGDVWANTSYIPAYKAAVGHASGAVGTYAYTTAMHEIGHALGMKHPHEGVTLSAAYDSIEYSVMSYKSYIGHTGGGYTNEPNGYAQSLMMLDIAAIQSIYGADYTTRSGHTTYSFDPNTGEMKVDGATFATPAQNRILRTIWDGNGFDTLSFALYSTDIRVDLNPGEATDLHVGGLSQKARLGYNSSGYIYASANIYMSLLHEDDARSLIEAAVCGSGNDVLIGNAADNLFCGGQGADTYTLGSGADTVRGSLSELLGDKIIDFGSADRVVATDLGSGSAIEVGSDGVIRLADGSGTGDAGDPDVDTSGDPQTVWLTNKRDQYVSRSDEDLIVLGLNDNDTIEAGSGDNRLVGGSGNDHLRSGTGNDTLKGGDGSDKLDGGDGDDVLVAGNERDDARGRDGNDIIFGNAGADRLTGDGGNDSLSGGDGDDRLDAGRGDNILYGGGGRDNLKAGAGSDLLYGGDGSDVVNGGKGADTYVFHSADTGTDTIQKFEFGSDLIEVDGFSGAFDDLAFLDSRRGVTIDFGAGFVFVQGARSAEFEAGDFVFYSGAHAGRDLPAVSFTAIASSQGSATELTGHADDINLASSTLGIALNLNGGDDTAATGRGNDTIDGGAGDDTIMAGSGSDRLLGGGGNDDLRGSSGRDVFVFRASDTASGQTGVDIVRDFSWKDDTIRLVGFDDISADDLEFSYSGRKAQIVVDDVQAIVFSNLRDHVAFDAHDLIDFG
jgi:serralysin